MIHQMGYEDPVLSIFVIGLIHFDATNVMRCRMFPQ